jgi:hypothetical protein
MTDLELKNYRLADIREFILKEFLFESHLFTQEDQFEESTLVVQTHNIKLNQKQILSLNLINLEDLNNSDEMFLLQFYAEIQFNKNQLIKLSEKPFLEWLNTKNSQLITGNIYVNNDGKLIFKYYLPFDKFEVLKKELFRTAFILVLFSIDLLNNWISEY